MEADDVTRDGQRAEGFPHLRLAGSARERGIQYGAQARERIHLSLAGYELAFAHYAAWDWPRAVREAQAFEAPIAAFEETCIEEMRGIAEGAAVEFGDILALNVRTEIMFSAQAREALGRRPRPAECTSFCVLPESSANGRLMIGQNWDWLVHCRDTVVVLEVEQPDRPDFVTVVEAGLLAKAGMNAAGLGLATNALVCAGDRGEPGVPFHVILRALLDAGSVTDALVVLQRAIRSSSANYLIADAGGVGIDVEAAPGDFTALSLLSPDGGLLLHTNHFLAGRPDVQDLAIRAMPDSFVRLARLRALTGAAPPRISVEALQAMLADHAEHPAGICFHADPRRAPVEEATIASLIMDPAARTMWLASGQPCSAPYHELDYGGFLAGASPAGAGAGPS